ncbi:hypothetical protein ACQKP0_10035 [Heyndrickxia sp. NPDC080065]|uniref:hypothetical protein n=1 Tax=Heyndrickxia sp. NPDC080065 TaxID=3390568 RepID=UPI003D045D31
MSSVYYFMFAVIIAVIGIAINFKIHMDKLKENPANRESIQSKFFIGIAIIEVIPIILVIFGFMNLTPVSNINELLLPGIITILSALLGLLFVFLQSKVDVTEEAKGMINTFTFIGFTLMMTFPIIAIVSMFIMITGA